MLEERIEYMWYADILTESETKLTEILNELNKSCKSLEVKEWIKIKQSLWY